MAYRDTLAVLVARVRTMIADTGTVWENDEIADALDSRRTEVAQAPLATIPTRSASGISYRVFYAADGLGDWEDTAVLETAGYEVIPDDDVTADLAAGKWTLDAGAALTQPVLYLTGSTYDVAAAAADLLEMWASKEKLSFQFSVDGAQYMRSQKFQHCLELAAIYRHRQRPLVGQLVRSDAW
jgi:hypothetical protein